MRSGDPKGVYVDTDCCTSCGVPWDLAPDVFAEVTGTCVVLRQPLNVTETRRVLRVFQTQDLDCIRYGGDDPRALRILARAGCADQCDAVSGARPARDTSPKERGAMGRWSVLGALVGLDLFTKTLAIILLPPYDVDVDPNAWLQIVLRTNPSGLGTWTRAVSDGVSDEQRARGSFCYLILAAYLLLLGKTSWSRWTKILGGCAVFAFAWTFGGALQPAFSALPYPVLIAAGKVGPAALFLCLWGLARRGLWVTTTGLFAAAALGNLLGLLIPPHEVIDFIYSRLIHATLRYGVFNLADLYFAAAIACLALCVARPIWIRLRIRAF